MVPRKPRWEKIDGEWKNVDKQENVEREENMQSGRPVNVNEQEQFLINRIKTIAKYVGLGFLGLMVIISFIKALVIVDPGRSGVVVSWGKVEPYVLEQGPHLVMPWYQRVVEVDVQVKKAETPAEAATKDIQVANSIVAVNYHPDPSKANILFRDIGVDYKARIIDPNVQEVIKAVTARYTAAELLTKREVISNEVKAQLAIKLSPFHLIVDGLSMVNFHFSKTFMDAVEEKQTAEQRAFKATNDLARIEIEAKQKVVSARAEAESLKLQKQEITPDLIKLRQIEVQREAIKKWDGELPRVTGGAMPFIDVADFNPPPAKK